MRTREEDDAYWRELERRQREHVNNIYNEFPLGTRVKVATGKKGKEKLGTIAQVPEDEYVCYAPHHVPVKLDGQSFVSQIVHSTIEIIE